ncbi:hypothetical protein RYX36_007490 [Vicia faba]
MTIFEVLQCSKVSTVVVLSKTIDFDHSKKWYYQACTKCSRSVRTKSGDLYFCENCVDVLPANPRIKIHIQVADVSGSSTFILFDRVATQELENLHHLNLFEDNDEIDQVSNNHTEVEDNLSKESVAEEFNQAYDKVSI